MMNSDWHSLGEVSYRKWMVYNSMEWFKTVRLDNVRVVGSPFGGPVALISAERRPPATISMYSSSGKKLVDLEIPTRFIVGSGWSDLEELVVVLDDGNVLIHNILGKVVRQFLLMDHITSNVLLECQFWGNGLVGITKDMQLYVAEGLSSPDESAAPRKYKLSTDLTPNNPYTSMTIIPPLLSKSGLLEILLGTTSNSIIVVDESETEDQLLQERIESPIVRMAVAPNGRFIACYRRDGVVTVMSTSFTTKVLDFDTKSMSAPTDIAWCGEDAVVLVWRGVGIVMVGPYGDWLNFPSEHHLHLISESDCLRVISTQACEIIQRVPAAVEAIQRIGSTDPAALLYDAMEAYEDGDPKSDENVRSLAAANQLEDAVHICITAAGNEFEISKQQAFLKAASYGKAFSSTIDAEEFVNTAKALRVLNDIRLSNIGLPLTMNQYTRLTPEVLISRLTIRGHHLLALKICELLKLKRDRVLVHWGCEKVKRMATNQMNDEEIRDIIRKKLSEFEKVSYLEIAASAYHVGRRRLATMILDLEQSPADQVPLLLSMQEGELALQKAVNSEDTDLMYLTLFHLERNRQEIELFYRFVYAHLEAANLLKMYYRQRVTAEDRTLLLNLLMFNKNHMEAGVATLNHAYLQTALPHRIHLMKEASQLFAQGRDLTFFKSITDEQIELFDIQKQLDLKHSLNIIDSNLIETISTLFRLSIEHPNETSKWVSEASKVIKKFRVSEKTVWAIRIDCYSKLGQWEMLMRLAAEKKSPVGYKPFALACAKYGQPPMEIEKYIEKIPSNEDRYDLYCDLSMWRKAMETAIKLKDVVRLQEVGRQCKDTALERQIQENISKF